MGIRELRVAATAVPRKNRCLRSHDPRCCCCHHMKNHSAISLRSTLYSVRPDPHRMRTIPLSPANLPQKRLLEKLKDRKGHQSNATSASCLHSRHCSAPTISILDYAIQGTPASSHKINEKLHTPAGIELSFCSRRMPPRCGTPEAGLPGCCSAKLNIRAAGWVARPIFASNRPPVPWPIERCSVTATILFYYRRWDWPGRTRTY